MPAFAFFNLLLERSIPREGRGHGQCLSWQLSLSVLSNHKIKCCHLAEIHKESSSKHPRGVERGVRPFFMPCLDLPSVKTCFDRAHTESSEGSGVKRARQEAGGRAD